MRKHLHITGLVQGVGFRPFIHNLAKQHGLSGWVKNSTDGVHAEVEGNDAAVAAFLAELPEAKPDHALIVGLAVRSLPNQGQAGFFIHASDAAAGDVPLIAADIATCADCRQELFDKTDRRFRYPFTNCTRCGPRYTIIRQAPYDRVHTTMNDFAMCESCRTEYENPANRRFHAQPNACPACGPTFRLTDSHGAPCPQSAAGDVFTATRQLIADGRIVAIKGLGGFHLACDARNEAAVAELRRRKVREDKPLAVMAGSIAAVNKISLLATAEEALLSGDVRPILLLDKSPGYDLAASVAPANPRIGVMVPYTPIHELLLAPADVWVMTSGNRSDEPIAVEAEDALQRLAGIADWFLLHNRKIQRRADDSVVRLVWSEPYILRRSRGYAPLPLGLSEPVPPLLACGGDLKAAFCLAQDRLAFISSHIGDLENLSTYRYFADSIGHYERLFHIRPQAVAHDLHPDYLSTRYAASLGLPAIGVQHHHAHIASVLAEQGLTGPVLGVAFDGTGYGTDGTLWGGEFLLADCQSFTRLGHCRPLRLPGGAQAIRQPWRMALSVLFELYGDGLGELELPFIRSLPPQWPAVTTAARLGLHSPLTSSAGRLFDAAAALLSLRSSVHYEGQAAVELELYAGPHPGEVLPYSISDGLPRQLDLLPAFAAMTGRLKQGADIHQLAAAFHSTLAQAAADMLRRLRQDTAVSQVALSGGVFQNLRLLEELTLLLEQDNFIVYRHRQAPPSDGGLSLGQTVIAGRQLSS